MPAVDLRRALFLVVPLGLAAALAGLLADPGRRAALQGPEAAAATLAALPEAQRFEAAFTYGTVAGRLDDLDGLHRRAAALPPVARGVFLDGAGHTWQGRSEDAVDVAQEITAALALEERAFFVDAAALHYTLEHPDDPTGTCTWVRALERAADLPATNGLRVGFQQARGARLSVALGAVGTWPPELWAPLAEELGWRIGDEDRLGELAELMALVPPEVECAVAQGAARGAVLARSEEEVRALDLGEVLDTVRLQVPRCEEHARLGVAWGLHLRLGDQVGTARQVLATLGEPGVTAFWSLLGQGPGTPAPPWAGPGELRDAIHALEGGPQPDPAGRTAATSR